MIEPDDPWPSPNYNPGSRKHLHALGVIAVQFASLERSIDTHYTTKASKQGLPSDLINLYYYSLNEEKRIEAVRLIFKTYEKDPAIIALIGNLLDYFQWCRHCRNQILHAERYPAGFGGDPDILYLTKRIGKQSPEAGHMKFSVERLRFIADKIREGVIRSAYLHLRLRYRDVDLDRLPEEYLEFVVDPLPEILPVPDYLQLDRTP